MVQSPTSPFRSKSLAAALRITGVAFDVIGMVLGYYAVAWRLGAFGMRDEFTLALTIICLGSFLASLPCFIFASALGVPSAEEVLTSDTRGPVLYLRSFKSDRGFLRTDLLSGRNERKTIEQAVSESFHPIGPVVAIGKPGDRLTIPGAARIYVGDDKWRAVVLEIMNRSQVDIWVQGKTAGLEWELQAATQHLDPCRLLLVIPAHDQSECDTLRRMLNRVLPSPLPSCPRSIPHNNKYMELFIFGSDWVPEPLPPIFRRFPNDFRQSLDYTASFAPFIQRLRSLPEKHLETRADSEITDTQQDQGQ